MAKGNRRRMTKLHPSLMMQANASSTETAGRTRTQEVFVGAYDDKKVPSQTWQWNHMLTVEQAETLAASITAALAVHRRTVHA